MNPNAEAIPDEIFCAVHKEFDLRITTEDKLDLGRMQRMSPKDFLKEFLKLHPSNEAHVQVAVLGESGSGKSHFIQWMRLNIPETGNRCVLTIPKARTSLKSIIQSIIDQLPPDRRHVYQDQLDRTAQNITTHEGQRNYLLSQVAHAIGEDKPKNPANEWETELVRELPNLFLDPHMRNNHFLSPGSIIDELANHIFAEPGGYRPAERRKEFTSDDLPPLGGNFFVNAAIQTRNLLDLLMCEPSTTIPLALDIINRNLNTAITLTLSLTGDSLIELMNDIRRFLRSQNKELILLIEDFARLQGVDRALLQALTIPASLGGEQLCELRWAMAVTTGYYTQTADTVQTRMNFIVSMDLPGGEGEAMFVGRQGLAEFATGYLNAARIGREKLAEWHRARLHGGLSPEDVPNPCTGCVHRDACHSAFGEVRGIGLYPLTSASLWNMARRADEDIDNKFNPRRFIKSVLIRTLDTYGSYLESGHFPPRQLLNDFGDIRSITNIKAQELQRLDPARYDRRITLLELWDGSGEVVNLKEGIHEAFDLPILDRLPSGTGDAIITPSPVPEPDAGLRGKLDAIQNWSRGGDMPQGLAADLRELLYPVIESHIDWDAEGLEKSTFAARTAGTKPFRQRSINFVKQQALPTPSRVQLELPMDPNDENEFNRTAIALQGLIQFSRHKHWGFEGGQTALVNLLECLDRWSSEVVRQIRTLRPVAEKWDPVTAAMELLALGGVLSGKVSPSQLTIQELFNLCFQVWPDSNEGQLHSAELKAIYRKVLKNRQQLAAIVRAWCSGTKGGQAGAFLDPHMLLATVAGLHRTWTLEQLPPEENIGLPDHQAVANLYRDLSSGLLEAVRAERAERLEWLTAVEAHIAANENRSAIVGTLRNLLESATQAGLPIRNPVGANLSRSLDAFQAVQFDHAVQAFKGLRDVEKPAALLPQFARGHKNAVDAINGLLNHAELMLKETENAITSLHAEIGDSGNQIKGYLSRIEVALTGLNAELTALEEDRAD